MNKPGDERDTRWADASKDAAFEVAGVIAGQQIAGPIGAMAGALVAPYGRALLETFSDRWSSRRRENAAAVLTEALDAAGLDDEGFLRAMKDPVKEMLTGRVLEAATDTVYSPKMAALGRVLARALHERDEARLDEAVQTVNAIADLEAPHVAVLAALVPEELLTGAEPGPRNIAWLRRRHVTYAMLEGEFPGYGAGLRGIVATLERHGLIAAPPVDYRRMFEDFEKRSGRTSMMPSSIRNTTSRWQVTEYGVDICRKLTEAAMAQRTREIEVGE